MKKRRKHIPQRTCVVCRRKTDKRRLTRIVRSHDEGLIVDLTGKRSGRGAYLCDDPACWNTAMTSQILDQALRTEIPDSEKDILKEHRPIAVGQEEPT